MASLNTQSFTDLVRNIVASVQASATSLVDLTIGSALRSVIEAFAAVMLWLQAIVVYVLSLTRAATSSGVDLDSWMAQFAFTRLGAVAASGSVTFSRFTSTSVAVIPVGSIVGTGDGTQSFTVATDTGNANYSPSLNGYIVHTGTSSITIPVVANNAGTQGNVVIGAISSINQGISGVDTVTNAAAFTSGVDAESDTAYRSRFGLYIASLSRGTKVAIGYAILNISSSLQYTILENAHLDTTPDQGYITIVVDDGSGYPSSPLLGNVAGAVESYRGLTCRYGVFAPNVITAAPSMIITSSAGYNHTSVVAAVGVALANGINGLGLGNSLSYTQLAAWAYSVAGVTNATSILLNGGTADIAATFKDTIKAGTLTVS